MRACEPAQSGFVERAGVRLFYEVFGAGETTLLLLPSWSIVHSRLWKAQVPYLSRHYRVVSFDGRGNGRSARPAGAALYQSGEFVADALAVLDATGTRQAVLVGISLGGHFAALLAARHPERVRGAVLIAPASPLGPPHPRRSPDAFLAQKPAHIGWDKYNRDYWRKDYHDFLEFFFAEALPEAHSTKQIEDCIGWGEETDAETLIDTVMGRFMPQPNLEAEYRSIRCPCRVIHGDRDVIVPHAVGVKVAQILGAALITLPGAGHLPICRQPAELNLLIREFVDGLAPAAKPASAARAQHGARVLYLSSPIGLGHARRDLAIARALKELRPQLCIDWLAQHPVAAFLEGQQESIHPASKYLVNESRHIESEAGEHDLHVFEALRRMDETLITNFMVFQEVIEQGHYDLVIADESWEVDHFLHEHPRLKKTALAWLTDFVGYLPMPQKGARDALLTADYNAEMIRHIADHPRVRDRSIFVGNPEDIVTHAFGPDLPLIRSWTEAHFDFSGYITGFDARSFEREALRARFGFEPGERICMVTVGGSGVGSALLRRIMAAGDAARRLLPDLRFVVVTGPRIDPASLPARDGVEIHGYLPDLHLRLAAADVAIVQGGLATCMELTACRVPFLYFPLRNHFEQQYHVRHRLERYRAGRCMDFSACREEDIAEALVQALAHPLNYRPVETDGHARAAGLLAEILP